MKEPSKLNGKPKKLSSEDYIIRDAIQRFRGDKDSEYWESMLRGLLEHGTIPIKLLEEIPVPPEECGKTKFDQLYDACMELAFPKYKESTLEKLLGDQDSKIKIWRIITPQKFGIAQVLLRASSFTEAFALGCDFVCRVSLRVYHKIPADLTLRVQFMSEKSLERFLNIRWANKISKRREYLFVGREYTSTQINGARLVALGSPKRESYSIIKYSELKDLKQLGKRGRIRKSAVESESWLDRKAKVE